MLGVGLVPILVAVYTSLTSENLSEPVTRFVGLDNYRQTIFNGSFLHSLWVTLLIVGFGALVQFPIGYVLAQCLNREPRGHRAIRTILLIPMLLTPVALAEAWLMIFNPSLGVARFLASPFVDNPDWLGSPTSAFVVLLFVNAWINVPFVMIMVLAGLASVQQELLEAAQVDGASWWMTTRYIVLPLLRPVLTVTLLVRVIADFQMFDLVYVLTGGGPGTMTTNLPYLAYRDTFVFYTTGAGASVAVAMAIITVPLYFAFVRLTKV